MAETRASSQGRYSRAEQNVLEPGAVSIDAAAEFYGISRAQYYRLMKLGEVPRAIKLGGRSVVSVEALRARLAA